MRNDVIVSIGCCLSSGAMQMPDDAEDESEAAGEEATAQQDAGKQRKAGRKGAAAKKQQLPAVDEDRDEPEEGRQQAAAAEAGSEFASLLPEGAELEEEEPLPPLASLRPSDTVRAELLQLLTARLHDIHAFSRSKALQTLSGLLRSRSLRYDEVMPLPALAGERLLDSSSLVRRAAVQLLIACMEFNPLGPDLQGAAERQRMQELETASGARQAREEQSKQDKASEILRQHEQSGSGQEEGEAEEGEQEADELAQAQEAGDAAAEDPELQQERRLRSALSFVDSLQAAVSAVCELLDSRSSADAVKAVHCIVTAAQFNIQQAQVRQQRPS